VSVVSWAAEPAVQVPSFDKAINSINAAAAEESGSGLVADMTLGQQLRSKEFIYIYVFTIIHMVRQWPWRSVAVVVPAVTVVCRLCADVAVSKQLVPRQHARVPH
jgi:hypothetical protein